MTGKNRLRWLWKSAVTASLALALAACGPEYPNTTFAPLSELGESIDGLWDLLLLWGMIVFVLVEVGLIYIVIRYRHRDSAPEPKQIHGHTQLEIAWTLIPAAILLFIAVPTVRVIFETQADPPANALQIDVRGYQWWWEFEYPEYGFRTANEVYIPTGRPVAFNVQTFNVLHSFWIPRLAGKRDAVNNRVNKIWFTARDSAANQVFNGFCAEFCGESHSNMQFRVFVLNETDFGSWAAHQQSPAVFPAPVAAGSTPAPAAAGAAATATASAPPSGSATQAGGVTQAGGATQPGSSTQATAAAPIYEFPRDRIPDYAVPKTPYPPSIPFDDNLTGDATRGLQVFNGAGLCMGCHTIAGNPIAVGLQGPNLTHIGSRTTIGGSLYPNTREYLSRWVKNSPGMKPGSLMSPAGQGLVSKVNGMTGMLNDQAIADVVAYLMSLK